MEARQSQAEKLRIAHVFRAPLGGLFRHVIDLAIEKAARGHEVGVFFDSGGLCESVDELSLTVNSTSCRRRRRRSIQIDPPSSRARLCFKALATSSATIRDIQNA